MGRSMRFCRYVLRTTDVDGARAFYGRVLGTGDAALVPLHEEAIARGARPHWLGMIGVADPEAKANAFVERGATTLGPLRRGAEGEFAVVRDPGGAIVAVTTPAEPRGPRAAWHLLHTTELARAKETYAALFDWRFRVPLTAGDETLHPFSWADDAVGAFSDVHGRAERHPHWLYFFAVPSLAAALAEVARSGGKAIVPPAKPGIAVCDDAQGAAFGLAEPGAL
jgi:predicted enzyme related to lactoylglutathione lyase